MGPPADQTIGDESPFTVVPARILDDNRVPFEQLTGLIEAEAPMLGVPPALRPIVLDSHASSLSGDKRQLPG
jgi:hypothetical protein